jgi:integrase
MKPKYRLFRRGQVFWCQDNYTGRQESLRTRDRTVAERLLHARNEAQQQPFINLPIARAYMLASDPQIGKRTWQEVMDEMVKLKHGASQVRWLVAIKSKAYDGIRHLPLLETRPEHLLRAMEISFQRRKTGQLSQVHFDGEVEVLLKDLPQSGPLFPYLRRVRAGDRATEFKQRCVGLGITGVSLHSYRYAWAERARRCGYPERFAQEALGHNSQAVHRAYARKAKVILPSLSSFEKQAQEGKILPFPSAKVAPGLPAAATRTRRFRRTRAQS